MDSTRGAFDKLRNKLNSLLGPVPHIMTGGSDGRERNRVDTYSRRTRLPSSSFPQAVAAGSGPSDSWDWSDKQGEADTDGSENSQGYLHPHSDNEAAVGSGLVREGSHLDGEDAGPVHPSSSIPSITHSEKPDSK